eukprot:Awhi_evm1s12961
MTFSSIKLNTLFLGSSSLMDIELGDTSISTEVSFVSVCFDEAGHADDVDNVVVRIADAVAETAECVTETVAAVASSATVANENDFGSA